MKRILSILLLLLLIVGTLVFTAQPMASAQTVVRTRTTYVERRHRRTFSQNRRIRAVRASTPRRGGVSVEHYCVGTTASRHRATSCLPILSTVGVSTVGL